MQKQFLANKGPFIKTILSLLFFLTLAPVFGQSIEKKILCPVCQIEFSAIVGSGVPEITATNIDGQPVNQKILPLPECPLCGGVFAENDFSPAKLKKLESAIWSADYQQQRQKSSWQRFAFLLESLGATSLELAEVWMKIAWAEPGASELHSQALKRASDYFKSHLMLNENEDSSDKFSLRLRLADILRQLGNFVEAKEQLMIAEKTVPADMRGAVRLEAKIIDEQSLTPAELPDGNPLHKAVEQNDPVRLKELIKDSTLLNERNMAGKTPLMLAIMHSFDDLAVLLINASPDLLVADGLGNTALHWAVIKGNLKLVRLLVKNESIVDVKNSYGQTPLHFAVSSLSAEIFRCLIGAGADVNQKDLGGNSLLHIACAGEEEIRERFCGLLLMLKADVNARNFADRTPLHVAAISGSPQIITMLVTNGAKIDARIPDGSSALFFCRNELIDLFLSLGANIELKNNKEHSPLIEALLQGDRERVACFKKTGRFGWEPTTFEIAGEKTNLWQAAASGNLAQMQAILVPGFIRMHLREIKFGETALHAAVLANQVASVKFLLNAGASPDAASDFLRTPLHYAAMKGNLTIVKLLVDKGANIFALDARGSTPLHEAAAVGARDVYDFLLSRGASDTTCNNAGKSPADLFKDAIK